MSEPDDSISPLRAESGIGLDELARRQHAHVVSDLAELAADVWDSDEELDAFLADFRASRNASVS